MAEVRWTPQAADDLESITEFIAKDSPQYAQLFAIDALEIADRLSGFPLMGRIVPEVNDSALREILFGTYRIVYRIKPDRVEILTVYHGAKLLDPSRIG